MDQALVRRPRTPTLPQIRVLLRLWLDQLRPYVPGSNSTWDACLRFQWIEPTDQNYLYPSGRVAALYRLTPAGLDAVKAGFALVSITDAAER